MELAKTYNPKLAEEQWYAKWKERGYFKARPGSGKPYCITIPPPNITGSLHIGHALNNSILDAMTRRHRMMGDNTLCLPGTDHASIATHSVVERELAKEGLTRFDLGREQFFNRCWKWREQYGTRIYLQLEKLGCSYDWDRVRFTMDQTYVDAIMEEFLRWWNRGLIYRGTRVVNWCPRCRSAISDIEVDSRDQPGELTYFRYPFADGSGYVTIATTRPETMLGDTAVAANPEDPRYAELFGKLINLPLTNRQIPLIADSYAKMEFGTGAVKVTPAHDLDDFEAGLRNNLPQVVVIAVDGTMTEAAGPDFCGMDRFDCRKRVLKEMGSLGLIEKTEPYTVKLPLCDRCKTILEPLLSEQWFARQKDIAQPAIDAVKEGKIEFIPERVTKVYLDWMENIRDWCISRQLWWGHRIPVWWTDDRRYAAGRNAEEAAIKLGVPVDALKQDEDVLDTWFSSSLWPFATLGWPAKTDDLAFWYPTNLLSTAQEILYLWVARMIMSGLDFIGEIPFHQVYIHATVLDEKGERMSKSKGNGVDPLDMIDRYGADALRFSLLQQAGMNQDIKFSEDRVKLAGQFCNKLWNASRFVITNMEAEGGKTGNESICNPAKDTSRLATPDKWILSRLNRVVAEVNSRLDSYEMDDASRALYSFVWDDFCDWYVELAKPRLRPEHPERDTAIGVLGYVLDTTLRLAHPMMPFITEDIWQSLRTAMGKGTSDPESIMLAEYPSADESLIDELAEQRMAMIVDSVRAVRNLKAELGVTPGARLPGAFVPSTRTAGVAFTENTELLIYLARLTTLEIYDAPPTGGGKWVGNPVNGGEMFIEIGDALDIPRELERIEKELNGIEKEMAGVRGRLDNPKFIEKAAPDIIAKTQGQAEALEEKRAKLEARKSLFS